MRKYILLIFISFVILLEFVYAQQIEKQILDIPGKQEGPLSVYGRYSVYMQEDNVWLYDSGDLFKQDDDKGAIQITKDGKGDKYSSPVIDKGNGNQVAWINDKKDIFVYDIKTKETKKLESRNQIIEAFDIEQKEPINPQPAARQSVVVSDSQGGAIVAWRSWDNKGLASFVDSQGNIKNKIKFSEDVDGIIAMAGDGKGGAIVGWTQDEARILARFIDAQGNLGNPIIISDLDGNGKILIFLISDSKGGAIATWMTEQGIFISFIDTQGNVKNIAITNAIESIPNIAPDGNGGAILTWLSRRENKIFALFIDAQGNMGNTIFIDDTGNSHEFLPAIAPDGKGGAIIGYFVNNPQGDYIFVKFLKSDGTVGNAIKIPPQNGITFWSFPVLAPDGKGGAILAFGSGVNGAGLYTVLIDSQGNLGNFILVTQGGGELFLSIDRNGQNGYLLTWISGDLFLDFLDLQGNLIKRVNVEPIIITGGKRVVKTISRNFQPETKENLAFYNGILAWNQYDIKYDGEDIRGYNLNEPGEPNVLDPQDKHYFFLTDLETIKVGNSKFQLNEIKPVLSKNSISFIGDSIKDLGDFGADISQELYSTEDFLQDIFSQRFYRIISQQEDGCNVVESSAERESSAPIWTEFCPSISTSKVRRDTGQPIATSDTSTFHSPLLKGDDYFYIEKKDNEFLLKSSHLANRVSFRIATGEKKTLSLNGIEHEIEFTEVVDDNTGDFKFKFDGNEFELIGADIVRIDDFEIGRDEGPIGCGGGPGGITCVIPLMVEELYLVTGTSMDVDKYRLAYLKDNNIETVLFPDIIQNLGEVSLLKSIPDGRGGTIIVYMSQGQDQGIRINFLDSQGNLRFKEPHILSKDWVSNIEISSDGNGGALIIFSSDKLQFIAVDSNGNIKLGPKAILDSSNGINEIILISGGQGGAIVAFTIWDNIAISISAIIIKSDSTVIGPVTIVKNMQYRGDTLSMGSYGNGGAMISWMEATQRFGFAHYVLLDSQGALKDFSGGKFPALEEAQQQVVGKFIRGDANQDGIVDLSDAVFTLNYLFLGGEVPKCLDASDVDDSGIIDLSDAVYLLNNLFLGGQVIPPPNALGEDTTDDALSCGEQRQIKKRLFFK